MSPSAATTARRLIASRAIDPALTFAALAGGTACVVLTIVLASGQVGGGGAAAVGAAAFLLVAAWCTMHRRVDHTLVAVVLYLGLLDGYVKLSTGSSTVTLARDALVIAIAAGALMRSAQTKQRIVLPPLAGFVLAFSAVVLTELANPGGRGLTAGFAGVRQHLEFVPLFFLGYAFVRTESQIRKALLLLVFCAAVGGVVSYIQSTLTPDQLAGWGPGYSERIHGTGSFVGAGRVAFDTTGEAVSSVVRPFGLGSEVGSGAAAAALALPGLVALLITAKSRIRMAVMPMSIGVGLAVATSGSRSALITVFITLVAFGLIAAASKNALKAVAGVAISVAIIYAVFVQLGPNNATSKRVESIAPNKALSTFSTERGGSVTLFVPLATQYPLGAGLGTVGPASSFQRSAEREGFNAETEWNFLLVETGIAGVIIYSAFLLRLMWLALARIRRVADPALRLYLAALAAPIFGIFVAGFSGPTSAATPYAPYLWLVSGVLAYRLVAAYRDCGRCANPKRLDGPKPVFVRGHELADG